MNSDTASSETLSVAASPIEPDSISRTVVETVADAEEVSAVELSPPLYDAIDPDALERFVDSVADGRSAGDVTVTFTYAGHDVTVTGDGEVSLDDE